MIFEIGALTHRGRMRRSNADSFSSYVPRHPQQKACKGAIFAVADGMDGHHLGNVVSRLAVHTVIQEYYRAPSVQPADSLALAVALANRQIWSRARGDALPRRPGTTLVAAVVRGGELLVANVGDCRAYLLRGRKMRRLTRDHSWVAEAMAAGVLSLREAAKHPWRNVVTRALGAGSGVEVDVFRYRVQPGDTLLLCSDGLHNQVRDKEMWQIANRGNPQKVVKKLIGLANRRRGDDDMTALVVRLLPDGRDPVHVASKSIRVSRRRMLSPGLAPIVSHSVSASFHSLLQVMSGLALAGLVIFLTMCWLAQAENLAAR